MDFPDDYVFDELLTKGLLPWIQQVKSRLAEDLIDSVELYLPPLGVGWEEAFSGDGYLAVHYTKEGKAEVESVNLPPLRLVFGEKPLVEKAVGEEIAIDSSFRVVEADFHVFPENVRHTKVEGQYVIQNSSGHAVSDVRLILRHAMDFSSLKVAGQNAEVEVQFYEYQGFPLAGMDVQLPKTLQDGEQTEISFAYRTAFHYHRLGRKPVGFTENRGFVLQEISWFPKLYPGLLESFPYTLEIKVPNGYLATSSGVLKKLRKGSFTFFTYEENTAQSPYFVWGKYREEKVQVGGAEVYLWTPADGSVSSEYMKETLRKIILSYGDMLPEPHFAAPQKYIAVTRFGGYGPVGNILLNDSYFTKEASKDPESVVLVAHELAHAWVNSISPPRGAHAFFLSEGSAVYLSNTNMEAFMPKEDVAGLWENSLMSYDKIAYRALSPVDLNEEIMMSDNQMFRAINYDKSALLLRSCESVLGRKRFLKRYSDMLTSTSGTGFTYVDLKQYLTKGKEDDIGVCMDQLMETRIVPDFLFERSGEDIFVVRKGECLVCVKPELALYDKNDRQIERRDLDFGKGKRIRLEVPKEAVRMVIDPEHRLLQSDIQNDRYPEQYFSAEEEGQIAEMIRKVFASISSEDTEYAMSVLAEEEDHIPIRQRQGLLGFLSKGKVLELVEIKDMRIIRYSDEDGLVKVFFCLKNSLDELHETRANLTIVKEKDEWRYTNLGIEVVGFQL